MEAPAPFSPIPYAPKWPLGQSQEPSLKPVSEMSPRTRTHEMWASQAQTRGSALSRQGDHRVWAQVRRPALGPRVGVTPVMLLRTAHHPPACTTLPSAPGWGVPQPPAPRSVCAVGQRIKVTVTLRDSVRGSGTTCLLQLKPTLPTTKPALLLAPGSAAGIPVLGDTLTRSVCPAGQSSLHRSRSWTLTS